MKKILVLIVTVFLLSGCVKVDEATYIDIIDEALSSKTEIYNTYRSGYKFYLPYGLTIAQNSEYNEVIKNKNEIYYLYIDLIGYLKKTSNDYAENQGTVYSKRIDYDGKSGYIEVNLKNDKYLVEIVYNYAKIEVIVDDYRASNAIANAIVILSSITYNDEILKSLSSENILSYSEENVDIFKTEGRENSNFLEFIQDYDASDNNADVPDYDMIK